MFLFLGGITMKLTEQQTNKRELREVTKALEELNPQWIFAESDGRICSSCETLEELLQLKMPDGVVKIGDPEESACYGFINVKIGEKKVSITANGME